MSEGAGEKGRGCGYGCMLLAGLFAGLGLLLALLVTAGLGALRTSPSGGLGRLFATAAEAGEDECPFMNEVLAAGQGEVKVVRVPLSGLIVLGEESWYAGNADTALRAIRRATHDAQVRGLILEVNSGGGGITDSDVIYKAVQDFKSAQPGRVVVTLMGDVAASGAYYIALASDCILAHPTTLTGSIGVIFQTYNVQELAKKLGVQDVTIKSGENKDLLNPFREVKPEQSAILQKVIAAMHDRFVTLVAENRRLPKETVLPLADGRVFLAEEAVQHRLIDGLGYREDAQVKIASLLEAESVSVYRYEEQVGLMDLLARPRFGARVDWASLLRQEAARDTRMMYRWSW